MLIRSNFNLLLAIIAAVTVSELVPADRSVQLGMALFTGIAWLWISEAIHISVTALLVPLLASLLGIFGVREALQGFAHPIIFLFMGGFALAAALQKYAIDQAIAVKIITLARGVPAAAILLLFLATALFSMWISNTATVAMMLPLAMGLLRAEKPADNPALYVFVLLGLAYAGNIGGITTLIGSPPNAIAASAIGLNFGEWLKFGIPVFLILFPAMLILLYLSVRPTFPQMLGQHLAANHQTDTQGNSRKVVGLIFLITASSWIFSGQLAAIAGISSGFDSLVAVAAIVMLIVSRTLSFEEFVEKTNWGILILFGGGLTLSAALQASGTSEWMATNLASILPADIPWLVLLVVCLFVIFLTELVSNTASAALLVPLFYSVAVEFGYSGELMAIMIAVCASCAFMLPVATPPNALVFATGQIPQRRMMRTGLVLNLVFAVLLATLFSMLQPF